MKNEQLVKELIDFVEGKIEINIIYEDLLKGKFDSLLAVYLGDKIRMYGKSSVLECLKTCGINSSRARYSFWHGVEAYLHLNGYTYNPSKKLYNEWAFQIDIQPSYVSIEDEDILNKYINEAPKELNKTQKKKWIKNRIKQDFKYDKTQPRWVQDPEWPILDGVPLVFKKQSKMTLDDERVYYTFYHPITLEEVVITQFY